VRRWTRKGVARAYVVSSVGCTPNVFSVLLTLEGGGEIPLIQLESKKCTEEKWGCEVPFYTFGPAKKWGFIHRMERPTDS
jgi:hypothetical protein